MMEGVRGMELERFKKEVERYTGQQVKYKDSEYTVKGVMWSSSRNQLVFYMKDDWGFWKRVYKEDVELM